MTATSMHFGPEWMRKQPSKPIAASPPPPPTGVPGGQPNSAPAPPGMASYSALVTPHAPPVQGKRDIAHPFKYSREEMLQVYRDAGGFSELPIEVERWEGIVREPAGEPLCLSDFTETEKKLYSSSLNSEIRRRQSTDYMAQNDRPKGGPLNSGLGLMGRRRRGDSTGTDQPPLSLPRKTSWSGTPGSLASPSTASPRNRMGSGGAFDGILNGTDTAWGSGKRRIQSGQPFTDRVDEEEEPQKDPGSLEAKQGIYASGQNAQDSKNQQPRDHGPSSSDINISQSAGNNLHDTTVSISNLNLNTVVATRQGPDLTNCTGGNISDSVDLTKIQWSYVDPSGNVQGPFSGETMQLWHDQHYFTDDLMMKRTDIDTDFTPLLEIKRRALGTRTFLSPLSNNVPPPGLGYMPPAPTMNPLLQRTGILDSPRQPSPQSYGRSSTLDSLIAAGPGTSTTGSASPSSSFGGGSIARGPISPDPIAVDNRLQRLTSDIPLNGRVSATGSYSSNDSAAMPQSVRNAFNEPVLQPNRASFDVPSSTPWQIPQGNSMQGWNVAPQDLSQLGQPNRFDQFMSSSVGHSPFARDSSPYAIATGHTTVDPFLPSSAPSQRFYGQLEQPDFLARQPDMPGGFQQGLSAPHLHPESIPQQQQPPLPQVSTSFNRDFEQPLVPSLTSPNTGNMQYQAQTRQPPPASPWGAHQAREPPRPRSFDTDIPTASNAFVVSLPQAPQWNKPQADIRPQDPWLSDSQTNGQEGQAQLTEEPQQLTTANINQHNKQQKQLNEQNVTVPTPAESSKSNRVTIDTNETTPAPTSQPSLSVASPSVASPSVAAPAKEQSVSAAPHSKRKAATVAAALVQEKSQPTSSTTPAKTPSSPPAPQKPAWSTDDEVKPKQTSAPMNLREIQEAERKKKEARKNEEKERERAARAAAAASPTEEVQFTASWGLPTSRAGGRTNGIPVAKEIPAAPSIAASAPVWTNAAKPVAKTMKEIQEEEERRKRSTKEKETVAVSAAKRVAQAPAVKMPSATAQPTGSAWTVVGSGGKHQTAANVAASRPSMVSQTSNPSVVPARPTGVASTPRSVSSPMAAKSASSTSKIEEEPAAPSLEFMKWMRDALRGLNSTVQFEEIAQMLLSFPLDPDDTTKELIAETVYGASTTLDGRQFMHEFVSRRKEDALGRSRGGRDQVSSGKTTSLADVVKAQPKQTQNDFGAFKVVKKKNKRS